MVNLLFPVSGNGCPRVTLLERLAEMDVRGLLERLALKDYAPSRQIAWVLPSPDSDQWETLEMPPPTRRVRALVRARKNDQV